MKSFLALQINYLQKILSLFYPIKIAEAVGLSTPVISLYRFEGRWQLSAATALYSDGAVYTPLRLAFNYLKTELSQKHKMLVLGAGLGSAVSVLHKMHITLENTLVEIDPQIITWAKPIIDVETNQKCNWICADVQQFVTKANDTYDLIVLDIFQDRIVPHFVTTLYFLEKCTYLMQDKNSVLVLNYIINNEGHWAETLVNVKASFKVENIISTGINRILILRNIA